MEQPITTHRCSIPKCHATQTRELCKKSNMYLCEHHINVLLSRDPETRLNNNYLYIPVWKYTRKDFIALLQP
jgi:hypothetical protein